MASVPPAPASCDLAGIVATASSTTRPLGWRDIVHIGHGACQPRRSTGTLNFVLPSTTARGYDLRWTPCAVQDSRVHPVRATRFPRTEERWRAAPSDVPARAGGSRPSCHHRRLVAKGHLDKYKSRRVLDPSVGVVDSLRPARYGRGRDALDALTVVPPRGHRPRRGGGANPAGRTTGGDIEAETVVIACGVWSPKIAAMAGAAIPLTPAVHQMISVGPVPQLSEREGEISFPIVRDMDTFCYERQHGADMEVGSYAHRAILMDPDDVPSIEASALSPTELPFTKEDFDPQMEQALELMPDILGDERVGVRYAINGLLSLTPDGNPIIGETPEVKGLWSVAAIWIKRTGPPGGGRVRPRSLRIDVHHSDIAASTPPAHPRHSRRAPRRPSTRPTASCNRPSIGRASAASCRAGCMPPTGGGGFSRPRPGNVDVFSGNEASSDTATPMPRETSVHPCGRRSSTAEHLRCGAGGSSTVAFADLRRRRRGPADAVQRVVVAQADVRRGRCLHPGATQGRVPLDLTVIVSPIRYRVVDRVRAGCRLSVLRHLPADGGRNRDLTSAWRPSPWGPRRATSSGRHRPRLSDNRLASAAGTSGRQHRGARLADLLRP